MTIFCVIIPPQGPAMTLMDLLTSTATTFAATDVGSIYCVGRNYAAHAKELNNPIPQTPLIFTKTRATICPLDGDIRSPALLGRCDFETEIAIMLGQSLYQASKHQAREGISHIGLALDLTLRQQQSQLKQQGHPWTLAKNFLNATPLSVMYPLDPHQPIDDIEFSLSVNNQLRQQGNSADMLFGIVDLIVFISHKVPLMAGDIILTGTPQGVGPLNHEDQLVLQLNGHTIAQAKMIRD